MELLRPRSPGPGRCVSTGHAPHRAPCCLRGAMEMAKLSFFPFIFPAVPVTALFKAAASGTSLSLHLPNTFLDKNGSAGVLRWGGYF